MTKKELLDILKDVPDKAQVEVLWQEGEGGYTVLPISQILLYHGYEPPECGCGVETCRCPETQAFAELQIYLEGHERYTEFPSILLPQWHPDRDPYDTDEHRLLYDSSVPLTPILESEKEWVLRNKARA